MSLKKVLSLLLVAASVSLLTATSAQQTSNVPRAGRTVAGILTWSGQEEGVAGVSKLYSPFSICGDYDATDVTDATMMVSAQASFMQLNRYSTYLSIWDVIAPMDGVSLVSCVTVAPTSISAGVTSTMYFLVGNSSVFWVIDGTVSRTDVGADTNLLFGLAQYQNTLYLLSADLVLYSCDISGSIFVGSDCKKITLSGVTMTPGLYKSRPNVAVNADGIFITNTKGLYWFSLTGSFIGSIVTLPFTDVHFSKSVSGTYNSQSVLIASTNTAIYGITYGANALTYTLLGGTEAATCSVTTGNVDGTSPTFCGITRVFPISQDEIYVTILEGNVVRSLVVPNATTVSWLYHTPVPASFMDANNIMPIMYSGMDYEVSVGTGIRYPNIALVDNGMTVDDTTWDTQVPVAVSQRYYDGLTTPALVQSVPYTGAMRELGTYFNKTNQVIFSDAGLLPMCSASKLMVVQRGVATRARAVLNYPFVYTDPANQMNVGGNPNITLIKLLMPAPFGYSATSTSSFTENTTTPSLLAPILFNETILVAMREAYEPDRQYDVVFNGTKYQFNKLNPEQLQQVRWFIYDLAIQRLNVCKALWPGESGSGSDGNALSNSGDGNGNTKCISKLGLTNVTFPAKGSNYNNYNMDIFVPDDMGYNFNITACLDGTEWWDPVEDWINNATHVDRKRVCDTGCIVGIAVASAVVAAILVVVIVVLTSKRRRLATVVAPAAYTEPKFASTLDDGSDASGANPLA